MLMRAIPRVVAGKFTYAKCQMIVTWIGDRVLRMVFNPMLNAFFWVPVGILFGSCVPFLFMSERYQNPSDSFYYVLLGLGISAEIVSIWYQRNMPAKWRAVIAAVYGFVMPILLLYGIFLLGLVLGWVRVGHS